MDKVTSIEEIVRRLADVRNLRMGFMTNFFLDENKHKLWVEKGLLFKETIGNTYFLVKSNENFWNVFYVTTTLESLKADFDIFNSKNFDKILMIDVVNRKDGCEQIATDLAGIGFHDYCKLVRMSKKTTEINAPLSSDVSFATKDDATEVLNLLCFFFDKKMEQIPSIEELEEMAGHNFILVLKRECHIVGFIIYELTNALLYLRYWFVHPDFRELGVGSKLMNRFLYEGRGTKRVQLWVICSNENAIKRYCHYGFMNENMYDYVITNRDIQYERKNY